MVLQIKPGELQPGDRFVPPAGPWASCEVEVVDVKPGQFGMCSVSARLVRPVTFGVEPSQTLTVARGPAAERVG